MRTFERIKNMYNFVLDLSELRESILLQVFQKYSYNDLKHYFNINFDKVVSLWNLDDNKEFKMIQNYKKCYQIITTGYTINEEIIKKIHGIIVKNIRKIEDFNTETYREKDAKISGTNLKTSLPCEIQTDLEYLIEWFQTNSKDYYYIDSILAFHNGFEIIHPFDGGNGRVGRIILQMMLYKTSFPLIYIPQSWKREYSVSLFAWNCYKFDRLIQFLIKRMIATFTYIIFLLNIHKELDIIALQKKIKNTNDFNTENEDFFIKSLRSHYLSEEYILDSLTQIPDISNYYKLYKNTKQIIL